MAMSYKGGVISATAPTTSAGGAPGSWTLKQQMQAIGSSLWTGIPDAYYKYVSLLLPGNGTNGAQNNTFLDSSSNNFTITRNGNTTQGTFTPYGQNWGNYFGATGQYLSVSYSSAFNLTGDFTIECWINPGNLPSSTGPAAQSYERIFSFGTYNAANSLGLEINSNDSGNLRKFVSWYNGTSYGWGSNNAVAPGNWYHVAMVRSGTTITLYLNGASIGTITSASAAVNTSQAFYIASLQGYEGDASAAFNGYISNFRIVKGTAVYTAAFTPPTSSLTAISGTSLLTCQSNRFIDNSSNAFAITVNGSPSIQRFSPFSPTTYYAPDAVGGSGYFDGSGDYLSAANNTALNLSTVDFTLECWVYVTSFSGNTTILDKRLTAGSVAPWVWYTDTAGKLNFYTGTNYITTTSFPLNAWTHLVTSRVSGTLYQFINGVSAMTPTSVTANLDTTGTLLIGTSNDASPVYAKGYIADLRIVKGSGVTSVTVPTAPLTAITNTSLLLSYTNAAIIDNAMMNDLETVGNAQTSTTQSKWGGSSMAFDGSGDWLSSPDSQNYNLGSADFTIECWVYLNNLTNPYGIISKRTDTATQYRWIVASVNSTSGTINVQLTTTGSSWAINANTTSAITASSWNHIAIVRNGADFSIYVNGVKNTLSSALSGSVYNGTEALIVGAGGTTGAYVYSMNGYIDDLRITKGYARYTATFTPPAGPFTPN